MTTCGKREEGAFGHVTSIVILSYNTCRYTRECIESIRRYTQPGSYEIIVVDNASTDDSVSWLRGQGDLRCIFNKRNEGFPKGCNQGMALATGRDILLLNSDTVVTLHWLENLRRALYSRENVGAVSCLTNSCSNFQKKEVSYANMDEMQAFAAEYNRTDPEKWCSWLYLVGFCLLLRREVYEKLGGMDERFSPGNFEDNDYCLRMRQAGYELLLCGDTFIHHYGSASFLAGMDEKEREKKTREYAKLSARNERMFYEKWGLGHSYAAVRVKPFLQMEELIPFGARVLVLDTGEGADIFFLARCFPGARFEGITTKKTGTLLAFPSFENTYCPDLAADVFSCIKEKYDIVVWLDSVLTGEQKAFLRRLANASLQPGGTLYYSAGGEVFKILPDEGHFVEDIMIVPIEYANFEARVRTIPAGGGADSVAGVTLGPGSYLVSGSLEYGSLDCHVLVGRYCSLGYRLKFIVGLNHNGKEATTYPFRDLLHPTDDGAVNHYRESNHYQIVIGNDVWIGADVTILGGVRIGNGAIVGSGAVVAKDVPSYAVVAGNPARVMKYRFPQEIIDKLQEIKWWNWPAEKIKDNLLFLENPENLARLFNPAAGTEAGKGFAESILSLRQEKDFVYGFLADFDAGRPIWKQVLRQYIERFSAGDRVVLLFASPETSKHKKIMDGIQAELVKRKSAPMVALINGAGKILPEFVRSLDCFITAREDISSQCVDFAAGHDIRIAYGLDDDLFPDAAVTQRTPPYVAERLRGHRRPLLTIGVPVGDRTGQLGQRLEHIYGSVGDNPAVEVLVVGHDAAEAAKELVKGFARKHRNLRYLCSETGAADAGEIWRKALGEFVAVPGGESLLSADVLPKVLQAIRENRNAAIIGLAGEDGRMWIVSPEELDGYKREMLGTSGARDLRFFRRDGMEDLLKSGIFGQAVRQ